MEDSRVTTTLISQTPPGLFSLATKSGFLTNAGQGRVSKPVLSKWLSQDRLYAQAYIGFIGALITRVKLPFNLVSENDRQSALP
jgi:hypothetical protein